MIINCKQFGVRVEGTELEFLGRAPRLSASSRAAMGWYHCMCCGEVKMIRQQNVRPDHTVSCGCKGRRQFIKHHESIASKISPSIRKQVFEGLYEFRRGRRQYRHEVAQRFRLDRYVIDFLVAAHQRFLAEVAKLGRKAVDLLSRIERHWISRITSRYQQRKALAQRQAMLDAMPWRDREAYLAAERTREAAQEQWWLDHYPGVSRMEALLAFTGSNPDASIEFGV